MHTRVLFCKGAIVAMTINLTKQCYTWRNSGTGSSFSCSWMKPKAWGVSLEFSVNRISVCLFIISNMLPSCSLIFQHSTSFSCDPKATFFAVFNIRPEQTAWDSWFLIVVTIAGFRHFCLLPCFYIPLYCVCFWAKWWHKVPVLWTQ